MTGLKFLAPCSFHVHESELDEEGSLESFTANQIIPADICSDSNGTVDIQFGDGSVAFCIPRNIVEPVDIPI